MVYGIKLSRNKIRLSVTEEYRQKNVLGIIQFWKMYIFYIRLNFLILFRPSALQAADQPLCGAVSSYFL